MTATATTTLRWAGVLLLIAGCAATPSVQQTSPVSAEVTQYQNIEVVLEAAPNVRQLHGYDITASELIRAFSENLKAAGKHVTTGSDKPGGKALEARLEITDFSYVSGASRGMMGIMAGRAVLRVIMTLRDKGTGNPIGVITAGHSSHHGQGVFSPTTSGQITAIAKELSSKITN